MTEHNCIHEADIAVSKQVNADIRKDIGDIKTGIADIFKVLNGNGKAGLVTQVAVHKFWLAIAWTVICLQTTGLISLAWYIIKKGLIKT